MPLLVHGITSKSSTSFPCVSEHGDSSRFIKNVLMRQSLSEVDRYYKVLCASKSSEVLKTPCMPDRECVGHLNTVPYIDSEQRCHSKDFEWTCTLFPSMIICCEEKNNLLAKAKTVKKPSEHWGGAIDQFASDFTPYI